MLRASFIAWTCGADIETFARELEARGRARATVTRRLCTIAGLYKYAVEEELLEYSPAAHVRLPRLDYESHATALDRNELGALLVAAGLGSPVEHALISLLALNGLRVSEATSAAIEHLGPERGDRTLVITRKGGKVVTVPLAPRTASAIDLATGERTEGPPFVTADVRPPPSTPGCRCVTCRKPSLTPTRAATCATAGHGQAWTGIRTYIVVAFIAGASQIMRPSRKCLAALSGQADQARERSCRDR